MQKKNWKIRVGVGLMIFSVFFFLALAVIPFLDMESETKIKLTTIVFIAAEVIFWSGGLLLGKELFTKYKSYFNPKNWFNKKQVVEEEENKA